MRPTARATGPFLAAGVLTATLLLAGPLVAAPRSTEAPSAAARLAAPASAARPSAAERAGAQRSAAQRSTGNRSTAQRSASPLRLPHGEARAGTRHALCRVPRRNGQASGFVIGTITTDLAAFDHAIGYPANLRVVFMVLGSSYFPARVIDDNALLGAETVLSLHPAHMTMTQIADGSADDWLRSVFAADVANVGRPVVLSFAPEMNGQWYSYGLRRTKPAIFVQAWRHVHDVLAGTTAGHLITWLWQPSAIHFSTPSPTPWWPGWRYVNEVGLDGYYVTPGDNFGVIFGKTIRLVRSLTRMPIVIAETAVGPSTGHVEADIKDLFAGILRYRLRGLVWFDIAQSGNRYHQDWRLQDHPAALAAFTAQVAAAERSVLRCQGNVPAGR